MGFPDQFRHRIFFSGAFQYFLPAAAQLRKTADCPERQAVFHHLIFRKRVGNPKLLQKLQQQIPARIPRQNRKRRILPVLRIISGAADSFPTDSIHIIKIRLKNLLLRLTFPAFLLELIDRLQRFGKSTDFKFLAPGTPRQDCTEIRENESAFRSCKFNRIVRKTVGIFQNGLPFPFRDEASHQADSELIRKIFQKKSISSFQIRFLVPFNFQLRK